MAPMSLAIGGLIAWLGSVFVGPSHPEPHQQDKVVHTTTKEVLQPAQGLDVAQERCPKYAGDETAEAACVLFHSGAITKSNGKYQTNVQYLSPVTVDTNRPAGKVLKCSAELILLPGGSIGWSETRNCSYQ